MKIGEAVLSYLLVLKLHHVSLNLNENQKSFFNDTFNLNIPPLNINLTIDNCIFRSLVYYHYFEHFWAKYTKHKRNTNDTEDDAITPPNHCDSAGQLNF